VARAANSGIRNCLGDSLGTFGSILLALSRYKPSDLVLFRDGKQVLIEKNFNTFIGKTAFIASGMKVEHDLSWDDRRLYMLSLSRINSLNLVPALRAIYSGKAIKNKDYLSFSYCRSIEIHKAGANNEIEYDGDPQGWLPCRISVAPDTLEVITDEL
jgi:diacylglycerol kinase family enzyme